MTGVLLNLSSSSSVISIGPSAGTLGTNNINLGFSAGSALSRQLSNNVLIGYNILKTDTLAPTNTTLVGSQVMANSQGASHFFNSSVTVVGSNVADLLTSANITRSTLLGASILPFVTSTLNSNNDFTDNAFLGCQILNSMTGASQQACRNTFLGSQILYQGVITNSVFDNVCIGWQSGIGMTGGAQTSVILGALAGFTGSGNYTNAMALGCQSLVGANNSCSIGAIGVTGGQNAMSVGIGVQVPTALLHVRGSKNVADPTNIFYVDSANTTGVFLVNSTGVQYYNYSVASYTPTLYNYYEEATLTLTSSGVWDVSQNVTVNAVRSGRKVMLFVTGVPSVTSTSGGGSITLSTVPTRFLPPSNAYTGMLVNNGGPQTANAEIISASGFITVYGTTSNGSFSSGNVGFYSFSLCFYTSN